MAKICDITGKGTIFGNRVSDKNNKSRRRFYPNLQDKKIYIEELGLSLRLRVSTAALRTMNKNGVLLTLKKAYKKNTLAPRLRSFVGAL